MKNQTFFWLFYQTNSDHLLTKFGLFSDFFQTGSEKEDFFRTLKSGFGLKNQTSVPAVQVNRFCWHLAVRRVYLRKLGWKEKENETGKRDTQAWASKANWHVYSSFQCYMVENISFYTLPWIFSLLTPPCCTDSCYLSVEKRNLDLWLLCSPYSATTLNFVEINWILTQNYTNSATLHLQTLARNELIL